MCGYETAHEGCDEVGDVETCYCLEDLCNAAPEVAAGTAAAVAAGRSIS